MGSTLRLVKGSQLTHLELDDRFADTYSQVGHGLAALDAVYLDASGDWQLARADDPTTLAIGVALDAPDSDTIIVFTGAGVLDLANSLGTAGDRIYLSQGTAGLLTTTKPSSGYLQQMGSVVSGSQVLVQIQPAESVLFT